MSAAHRYDYAQSGCGGLEIALAATRVVLRASGALWFPTERLLAQVFQRQRQLT